MVRGNEISKGDEDGHLELRTTHVPQAYDKTQASKNFLTTITRWSNILSFISSKQLDCYGEDRSYVH